MNTIASRLAPIQLATQQSLRPAPFKVDEKPVDSFVASPAQEEPSAHGCPLTSEFHKAFFEDYQASKCGENIRRFLTRFPEPEALHGAKVLGIENKGFSYFGLTRALHTRDTKGNGEAYVTDKNWYHHVILEKDGRIFDFDYGIEPKVVDSEEYFETMFLNCDKVSREDKLKDYRVQVIDAQEYLRRDQDTSSTMSFRDYGSLQGWGDNLKHYQIS